MQDKDEGLSRRKFLAGTAAGVGGLGAMAILPTWALKGSEPSPQFDRPLVVYVKDAAAGELVLLVGDQEIVTKDRALVSKLVQCCGAV